MTVLVTVRSPSPSHSQGWSEQEFDCPTICAINVSESPSTPDTDCICLVVSMIFPGFLYLGPELVSNLASPHTRLNSTHSASVVSSRSLPSATRTTMGLLWIVVVRVPMRETVEGEKVRDCLVPTPRMPNSRCVFSVLPPFYQGNQRILHQQMKLHFTTKQHTS